MLDVLADLRTELAQREMIDAATGVSREIVTPLPSNKHLVNQHGDRVKPLSTKWRTILTLELRGWTKTDIANRLGRSYASIVNITNTVRYREYRDEMLLHCDEEFLNLKPTALRALRNALTSTDEKVSSANARWYFEMRGYGKGGEAAGTTAEEVIAALFKKANVTIEQHAHIHVDGATHEVPRDAEPASGSRQSDTTRGSQ